MGSDIYNLNTVARYASARTVGNAESSLQQELKRLSFKQSQSLKDLFGSVFSEAVEKSVENADGGKGAVSSKERETDLETKLEPALTSLNNHAENNHAESGHAFLQQLIFNPNAGVEKATACKGVATEEIPVLANLTAEEKDVLSGKLPLSGLDNARGLDNGALMMLQPSTPSSVRAKVVYQDSSPTTPRNLRAARNNGATLDNPATLAARSVAQPENAKLVAVISEAGKKFGVDPNLSLAVAHVESSLNPRALSSDGHNTKGLFQLKDSTAADMLSKLGVDTAYNPYDPELNSYLGNAYLNHLDTLLQTGVKLPRSDLRIVVESAQEREKIALAAYNAGIGTVARAQQQAKERGLNPATFESLQGFLPQSTCEYVSRVQALRAELADVELRRSYTA